MRAYMERTSQSEVAAWVYGSTPPDEEDVVAETGLPVERADEGTCEAMLEIPMEVRMALEGFNRILDLGSRGVAAYAQA